MGDYMRESVVTEVCRLFGPTKSKPNLNEVLTHTRNIEKTEF